MGIDVGFAWLPDCQAMNLR